MDNEGAPAVPAREGNVKELHEVLFSAARFPRLDCYVWGGSVSSVLGVLSQGTGAILELS